MKNRCTVCNHPHRLEIDQDLLRGLPCKALAPRYGLSPWALRRHANHLALQLDKERRGEDQARFTALLDRLDLVGVRLDRLLDSAAGPRGLHAALGSVRRTLRLASPRADPSPARAMMNANVPVPQRERPKSEISRRFSGLPAKCVRSGSGTPAARKRHAGPACRFRRYPQGRVLYPIIFWGWGRELEGGQ